jgi:Uma2 family endonuclease
MPPTPAPQRKYSWEDYRSWNDGKRWEVIDGEVFAMTPAPSLRHQHVAGALHGTLFPYFKKNPCDLFNAPTAVKLADDTVVQPDLLVVCDRKQEQGSHIDGAPTLVIEVVSPSSIIHDRMRKMVLYARHGVRELWLVTPFPSLVEVYVLEGGKYAHTAAYAPGDTLRSPTFPDLTVAMDEIFDFPPEEGDDLVQLVKEGTPPGVAQQHEADGASII